MPRRRELKGVAAGIAQKFVSRYNDIGGYWALGKLYQHAIDASSNEVSIDILSATAEVSSSKLARVTGNYRDYLFTRIDRLGFDRDQISAARISVYFDVEPTLKQIRNKYTWGKPFLCQVSLVDDLSMCRDFEVRGWCGVHDPSREQCNARVESRWWMFWHR